MKILFITNLYPPYVRGGAEYLGSKIVEEFAKQGHTVVVVTSAPWEQMCGFKPQMSDENGVRVYRFFPFNLYWYGNASRYPLPIRLVWHIFNLFNHHANIVASQIVNDFKPDVAISFNLMGLGFGIPKVLAQNRVKHIHVLHDVQLLNPSGLFMWVGGEDGTQTIEVNNTGDIRRSSLRAEADSVLETLYQSIIKKLFACVHAVVSPSKWLLQEHEKRGFFEQSNKAVIPNPVPASLAVRNTKSAPPPFRLLYDGQLAEHKGIFWLVNVLCTLERQDFNLTIVARGDDARKIELEKLIQNDSRFVLLWQPEQKAVDELYATNHVTVVPSLCYENSPGSVIKSLQAGTLVLASRIGGIPELVEEGKNGWLFTPGDKNDFVNKLNTLLSSKESLQVNSQSQFVEQSLESYTNTLLSL